MKWPYWGLILCCAWSLHAATTNNDDSCDLSNAPAATLLLPYFEVDFNAPQTIARTTLFTVYNVTQRPQIARVTLWTDWSYPLLSFDLFLTGYDVQAINLYDILGPRGVIASADGTEPGTACQLLPGAIPKPVLTDLRTALTAGTITRCGTARIGGTHTNAIGYATIDVVATCSGKMPVDAGYFDELLYDNVLDGDYQWINPNPTTGNYASGNPLVHIRAVPEGGAAGTVVATNLPYTFYDRYTRTDRRQPLPSTFAARYIQGGTGGFNTDLVMWREGVTAGSTSCTYAANSETQLQVIDIIRFDEHENPTTYFQRIIITLPSTIITLPAASKVPTSSAAFPPMSSAAGDVGGWLYLNLSNRGSSAYSTAPGRAFDHGGLYKIRQSQNWAVVSMNAEGRYEVAFDSLALANGCSPAPGVTNGTTNPIGPGGNANP